MKERTPRPPEGGEGRGPPTVSSPFRGLGGPLPHGPLTTKFVLGTGQIDADAGRWTLSLPSASRDAYSDAQLHDYAGLARADFPWRPPLVLTLRARLSKTIRGTAGFGFWNNPLAPWGGLPALPQAAWFLFASAPSAMELAQGVPGYGWKAAAIDAGSGAALRWGPFAPFVLAACNVPAVRRSIWPYIQRDLAIDERLLDVDQTAWHDYQLVWLRDRVIFGVDGRQVLMTRTAPRGPLGLVIWIDNQWARVTPAGSFGWGLLDFDQPQWLVCEDIRIISPQAAHGQS